MANGKIPLDSKKKAHSTGNTGKHGGMVAPARGENLGVKKVGLTSSKKKTDCQKTMAIKGTCHETRHAQEEAIPPPLSDAKTWGAQI